jgi:hypothetical protein
MAPTADVGGSTADILDLLESVAATVIGFAVKPEGDADVLATFGRNVRRSARSYPPRSSVLEGDRLCCDAGETPWQSGVLK